MSLDFVHLVYFPPVRDDFQWKTFFFDKLLRRPVLDPDFRDQRTEGERVSFGFFASLFADAVKIRGLIRVRSVHQVMRKFMKHYEQLLVMFQLAINSYVMFAKNAVIKAADPQGHLFHNNFLPFAEMVKIPLRQRFFVPMTA